VKFLPLVLANLRRSPLRSVLTAAAIAFAVALVCLLRTMPEGLETILDYASSGSRVVVVNKAGFDYPLPYAHLHKVRAISGVHSALSWTWYGGVFEVEKGVTFPSFATEPELTAEMFPEWEIPADVQAAFAGRRDAAIIGRATAKSYGWKVGDRIALRGTAYPVDLDFRVVGELPHDLSPVMLFHREYLAQALQAVGGSLDTATMLYVRVDDRERLAGVGTEIDALFRNSPAQTLAEPEKEYFRNMFSTLEAFVAVTVAVSVLVALCIVFIAANTASLSVRERAAEIAVLKAHGVGRRLVFSLLVVEAAALALVGGLAGALGAMLLTLALKTASTSLMSQLGPLGSFVVTYSIMVQGLFLSLFVGMLSGVVPSFGAARRSVTETMRDIF
jgi:putative ABC transport system permease protein